MGTLCSHLLLGDKASSYGWKLHPPNPKTPSKQQDPPPKGLLSLLPSKREEFEWGSLPEGTMETELQQAGGRNTVYATTCHAQGSSCPLRTEATGRTGVHHPDPCWRPWENDPKEPCRGDSLRERGVGVQEVLVRKMNFCRSLGGDLINDSSPPPPPNLTSHICWNSCALPPKRMRLTDRREWKQNKTENQHSMSPTVRQAQNQHHLILQQPYEVGFKVITYRGLATLNLTWFLALDLKPGSAMYCDVEACETAIFIKKTTEYWQCHTVQLNIAWSLHFFKPVPASLKWR